jgi:hypothetical protein
MLRDFHYYAVRVLAHHAGFAENEAHLIAYTSQYVDDSTEGDPISFTEGDYCFDPIRSAWTGLESFGPDVQRKVYMPFHFVPPRMPREGVPADFTYAVEPGGEVADALVEAAIHDDSPIRLHRLGVALHAYADSWSHEGFSGRLGPENDIEDIRVRNAAGQMEPIGFVEQLLSNVRPDVGHAEAGYLPDLSWAVWSFRRNGEQCGRVPRSGAPGVSLVALFGRRWPYGVGGWG